jgi:hypothetical protein
LLALPRLLDDLVVAVLNDRDVLHVRSVDSHDGVHTLPERLLLPADSWSTVSPRPRMSRTDTYLCALGSSPTGHRGVDIDRALVVRAPARLAGAAP